MQSLCKNHFLQQLYRKIDGAVLWSQNERNLDCVITFQTHSILQRFMLRFDFLQMDCNDHLYIYDGAHAVGTYKVTKIDQLNRIKKILWKEAVVEAKIPLWVHDECMYVFSIIFQLNFKIFDVFEKKNNRKLVAKHGRDCAKYYRYCRKNSPFS